VLIPTDYEIFIRLSCFEIGGFRTETCLLLILFADFIPSEL